MASQQIWIVRLFSQALTYCVLRTLSRYFGFKRYFRGHSKLVTGNLHGWNFDVNLPYTCLDICVPPACWRPLHLQFQLLKAQCHFFFFCLTFIHQNQFLWNLGWGTGHAVAGTCLISCRIKLSSESRHHLNNSPLCAVCSGLGLTGVNNFSVIALSD